MSEAPHARQYGGDGREPITAADVAALIGGRVLGDADTAVSGIAPLDRATPADLSFLAHARYRSWFAITRAGVVLVDPEFQELASGAVSRIVVERPTDAMVALLAHFHRPEHRPAGVHATALIGERVVIGEGATVEAYAVVGDDVVIGPRAWIGAHAAIGERTQLGADVRVHPGATVYRQVELGDRVIVHSGARIGREGFGFVQREGRAQRIPHVGRCVLEHDVEVGANSCVDRGSVDDTVIGAGTKIDNLVHIAHNVRIGRGCFLAAQVGIAGSARIGDGVQMGGQVGIGGHVNVGTGVSLAGQAGVIGDVPASATWSGYPARPHKEQLRTTAALSRLARLLRPIERMLGGNT